MKIKNVTISLLPCVTVFTILLFSPCFPLSLLLGNNFLEIRWYLPSSFLVNHCCAQKHMVKRGPPQLPCAAYPLVFTAAGYTHDCHHYTPVQGDSATAAAMTNLQGPRDG